MTDMMMRPESTNTHVPPAFPPAGPPPATPAGPPSATPAGPPPGTPPAQPPAALAGPPPAQPPGHRRDSRWPRRFAGGAAILALVTGGGVTGGVVADRYASPAGGTDTTTSPGAGTATAIGNQNGNALAAVAAKVSPSIVTVLVDGAQSSSLGSGVILSADGLVLTNNHVIAAGGTVSVRLSDGRTVPASVVAADSTHDLALVRADGVSGLTPATFAPDDSVAVGDTVLAFGAPLGLEGTVTSGIVSALDREMDTGSEKLTGLLQTDAAINEGNSGGALVDTSGRVIGINVAIATAGDGSTGNVGLGFAIPSGTVAQVVQELQGQSR